jgi:hypothetical protein
LKKEEEELKKIEDQKKYKAESSIGKMGAVYFVFELHSNGNLDELIIQARDKVDLPARIFLDWAL